MWGRSFEIHQEPHLALRTVCFGATDLFPNTMLSSSRTVFSFTCSSFRLSAASGSNYIHRRWAWLSWFNFPCLPSSVPTPPSLGLYPNAYSNLSAQASPGPKLNSWPTPSQESVEFCGQKAKEQRESTATLTPKDLPPCLPWPQTFSPAGPSVAACCSSGCRALGTDGAAKSWLLLAQDPSA